MKTCNIRVFIYKLAGKYPTPSNLSYLWNFGIFALFALLKLVMYYTPRITYFFYSVAHIMRDVNYGWLLGCIGSKPIEYPFLIIGQVVTFSYFAFFFVVTLVDRIDFNLVTREALWCSGVIILLLRILTAFLGYILLWGQMSLWGATLISFRIINSKLNEFLSYIEGYYYPVITFLFLNILELIIKLRPQTNVLVEV